MTLPTLLGIAALFLWGFTIPLSRAITEKLGTRTTPALVCGLAGIAGLAAGALGTNPGASILPRSSPHLWICGTLFVAYFVCLYLGLGLARDRHQALEVMLLNYLWPTVGLLLSIPLGGRSVRALLPALPLLAPGCLAALIGIGLVLTSTVPFSWRGFTANLRSRPLPYLCGFGAAISWGLYSNLERRLARPGEPGAVPFFLLATGIVFLAWILVRPERPAWNRRSLIEVAAAAALSSLGYVFWGVAMRAGDITFVLILSFFVPVLATLFGWLYLRIAPGWKLWAGCAFLVAGAVGCHWALAP